MNVVALDIGNSDIKFGLFRQGELVKFWRASDFAPVHQYKQPGHFSNALRAGLASIGHTFEGLVYSTVVPEMEYILKKTLQYCFTVRKPPVAIKPGVTRLPLKVEGYPPGQLGADRLVSACGAYLMYPDQHIILADFGTAATFDVITADARFLGGVIAPGIESFATILPQKTSLLPYVPFAPCHKAIGQNTLECMQSGVSFGYLGLVKEIITQIKVELATQYDYNDVTCLATGGGAQAFLDAFPGAGLFSQVDPTMTIKGLYALYLEATQSGKCPASVIRKAPTLPTVTPLPVRKTVEVPIEQSLPKLEPIKPLQPQEQRAVSEQAAPALEFIQSFESEPQPTASLDLAPPPLVSELAPPLPLPIPAEHPLEDDPQLSDFSAEPLAPPPLARHPHVQEA